MPERVIKYENECPSEALSKTSQLIPKCMSD